MSSVNRNEENHAPKGTMYALLFYNHFVFVVYLWYESKLPVDNFVVTVYSVDGKENNGKT